MSYCSAWSFSIDDPSLPLTWDFQSFGIVVVLLFCELMESVLPTSSSDFAASYNWCFAFACLCSWSHIPPSGGGGGSYCPLCICLLFMSAGSLVISFMLEQSCYQWKINFLLFQPFSILLGLIYYSGTSDKFIQHYYLNIGYLSLLTLALTNLTFGIIMGNQ